MKATIHRLLKLISGWVLVLLGIIGWFLPVIPGTLFVLLGLALLSTQSEWVREKIEALLDSLRARFPRQAHRLQSLKEGLVSRIRKEGSP